MPSEPHPEHTPDQDRTGGAGSGGDSEGSPTLGTRRAYELLLAAVETHALPRLLAAHAGRPDASRELDAFSPAAPRIEPQDVEALLACVATPDFHLAEAVLATVARRGFSRAELLADLLTPAARQLHARWRDDQETFAAVALATGRLQRLLRSDTMPAADARPTQACGTVLISSRPEDPRPLEAAVAADFFRVAQWDSECLTPRTEGDLTDRLKGQSFDCLVLIWDHEDEMASDERFILRLRRASANHGLIILLSGLPDGCGAAKRLGAEGVVQNVAALAPIASDLMISRVA